MLETETDLKPCPFCGGDVSFMSSENSATIECVHCPAKMEFEGSETLLKIFWNQRDGKLVTTK